MRLMTCEVAESQAEIAVSLMSRNVRASTVCVWTARMFSIPYARRRPQPPADSTLHTTTAPPRAGLCRLKKINFLGSGLLTLSQWHKFRANLKEREDLSHLLKLPALPLPFVIRVTSHLCFSLTSVTRFMLWSLRGTILKEFEEQLFKAETLNLFWFSK